MANTPTPEPARRRSSTNGGTMVQRAINQLTPLERKALFWLGFFMVFAVVARWVVMDLVLQHGHEGAQPYVELGGSLGFSLLGISLMIPPLGMWIIRKAPLPRFLRREEEK